MNKILTHKKFGGSYDFNGGNLTCVLRLYNRDKKYYMRHEYAYCQNEYEEISESHWNMSAEGSYACKYFNDDGSRPFKSIKCSDCKIRSKCVYVGDD
jgi:hypothetical protein